MPMLENTGIPGEPTETANPGVITLDQGEMKKQLHSWARGWINSAKEWRKNSWELQWDRWQRNADSIFDPEMDAKKEAWQSRAVWPITASHRETIKGNLVKTIVGPQPTLEVKSTVSLPAEVDQSQNIRDITLKELDKAQFESAIDDIMEDVTTYGTGFMRVRWLKLVEDRVIQEPIYEELALDAAVLGRAITGQRQIVGYQNTSKPVLVYDGAVIEWLPIRDVFIDPKSLKMEDGNPKAHRYHLTLGDIMAGAEEGVYFPEAALMLKNMSAKERTPEDKQALESDRQIQDTVPERPDYAKKYECFELWARVPKKWVMLNGEPIDDPEKLVPARIIFSDEALLAVEPNRHRDGESNIHRCNYFTVAGQFYGRGVPEQLKDVQLVSTEEICQRLDAKAMTLNPMFGVIEKAVLFPDEDMESKPGGFVRLNAQAFGGQPFSVEQVLRRFEMGTIDRAAFIEPQEWERIAQERTGVNRVTFGTAGQTRDANETLGGMEMLKNSSGDKFAYTGMMIEFRFLRQVFRAVWKRFYENLSFELVVQALGPERAATFLPPTPEEAETMYAYIPQGVYTMENKALRQARLAQMDAQFGMMPWLDRIAIFDAEMRSADEDPEKFKLPEAEALQVMVKAQEIAANALSQMQPPGEGEGKGKPPAGNKGGGKPPGGPRPAGTGGPSR